MKKKNLKKLVAPLATVTAAGIGMFFGLESTVELESGLNAVFAGVITIVSAFGVWSNNDKNK